MSEEPIYCFNGNECCYNIETQCIFYQGTKDKGTCLLEPLKGGSPAPVSPTTSTEPQVETPKLEIGKYVDLEVPIVNNPEMSKGNRQDGTEWIRTTFTVNVDGEELRVTLWDELAKKGMEYSAGQYIKFKGIQVKEYKGELQLNSSKYTEIPE